jgi:hypothetical protein
MEGIMRPEKTAERDKIRAMLQEDHTRSDRSIARLAGVSHPVVAAVRGENPAWSRPAPDVPLAGLLAEIPEGWACASIRTDERPPLDAALAVLRSAAETGELDRDVLAEVVAIRWDLKPGDRLEFDDGRLYREQGRPRRTVAHRAG